MVSGGGKLALKMAPQNEELSLSLHTNIMGKRKNEGRKVERKGRLNSKLFPL